GDLDKVEHALNLLGWKIANCRCFTKDAKLFIAATRKTRVSGAAETAAIGWLADAVKRNYGKPHYGRVATLASCVLATKKEVSLDRVRAALVGTKNGRLWNRRGRRPVGPLKFALRTGPFGPQENVERALDV
ncbi:hypothetical protein, partial [Reyranella soli]|uniref:hypothetical protein n=1 Tax=Reyranella soli TaxID=1230389 RepID=UPI001C3F978F